jgi:hypothetical protein
MIERDEQLLQDERTLILLSAYADGELDAGQTLAFEARLAQSPALQRSLASWLSLDLAAQRERIPAMPSLGDSKQNQDSGDFSGVAHVAVGSTIRSADRRLCDAARTLPIPAVSASRYARAWLTIRDTLAADRRAQQVMALDDGELNELPNLNAQDDAHRRNWQILDRAAARIAAPRLDAARANEAWQAVALDTFAVPEQTGAVVEMIEAAARAETVPEPAAELFAKVWNAVAQTFGSRRLDLQHDPVPTVTPEKWNAVWSGVERVTSGARPGIAPVSTQQLGSVVQGDFAANARTSRGAWHWGIAAAMGLAAATVAIVLALGPRNERAGDLVALNDTPAPVRVPEIADDRYELELKYIGNQAQPVICFFLKDEPAPASSPWWLPD